jgi:hypothetical protein
MRQVTRQLLDRDKGPQRCAYTIYYSIRGHEERAVLAHSAREKTNALIACSPRV